MTSTEATVTARANSKSASTWEYPSPLVIAPTTTHTHTFIILHGRGSTGHRFGSEFLESAIPSYSARQTLPQLLPAWKFIFPTAKRRRAAAMKRVPITQWFDLWSLIKPEEREHLSIDGMCESAEFVHTLIRDEIKAGIPPENIILGGLSQGCAMGIHVLLSLDVKLGAFVGMSGWMPFRQHIADIVAADEDNDEDNAVGVSFSENEEKHREIRSPRLQALDFLRENLSMPKATSTECLKTPIFLGHGSVDCKVACVLGKLAGETLRALDMDVTWKVYIGFGHWYKVPDEIDDFLEFLKGVMNILEGT